MKLSAESLKKLTKGACYYETERGYLTAFKYSTYHSKAVHQGPGTGGPGKTMVCSADSGLFSQCRPVEI